LGSYIDPKKLPGISLMTLKSWIVFDFASFKQIFLRPENYRILLSRIFGVVVFLIVLFTAHSWEDRGVTDITMELAGLALIMVGTYGRIWSSIYLCGRKKRELVVVGPFSLTRNPLYLFNLIGALGLGFASENLLVFALITIAFALYYPLVIKAEERELEKKYGDTYRNYKATVPRLFPRTLSLQEPEKYEVYSRMVRKVIMEAMWFVWLFILFEVIESLHESGILPVLWKIP